MDKIHVMPTGDLIDHEDDEDCICQPAPKLVKNDDGTDAGWIITHHSLDGREFSEPDYTGPPKPQG